VGSLRVGAPRGADLVSGPGEWQLRLLMGLNPPQIRPYPYFKSPNYHPPRQPNAPTRRNPKSRQKMICDLRADLLP
jgi:hypothetical protein